MKQKTIVAIFAHPDDEAFGPGGSLATLSQDNDVYLICVTNGDSKNGSRKEEIKLGKIRKKELQASAKILGIKQIYFLGFRDGNLNNNQYHAIVDKIKPVLQKLQPEQLITFEPRGVTGHTDHVIVSNITAFLFHKLTFVNQLWYWCNSDKQRARINDYFIFFPPGYTEEEVHKIVNVEPVWQTKLKAMHCHQSQKHDIDWVLAMFEDLAKEEYFLVINK